MPPTDTTERGLESLIMVAMTGTDGLSSPRVEESHGGTGWIAGSNRDYDRDHALDIPQLLTFLRETQPETLNALQISTENPANRRNFLHRLSTEIGTRGVIDVLRRGITHGPHQIDLFKAPATEGNYIAAELYARNRFVITRQLQYSNIESRRALDLVAFVNGLPVATFELKNSLTKQTVEDAVEQYRRDRDPDEKLFGFGRCMVHFALDDSEVRMCTELKGKASWFLPFNKGFKDGAGNPPNGEGLKTEYLWKEVLAPESLTNIIWNFAQVVKETNQRGRASKKQVFPRYHQLCVVREALRHVLVNGCGHRYLVQHSAGSGKSNSIAWLSHQLVGACRSGTPVFDSVVVVTDRKVLDSQIQNTIKQFMQVRQTVGHAETSADLRRFIEEGRRVIISTVQKFPHIVGELDRQRGKSFAVIIDEAHSSQGGRVAAAMNEALAAPQSDGEEPDPEDTVNAVLEERMRSRKLLPNASYFAFTATPKNKTLEMFGTPEPPDAEGKIRHRPFHSYTMKQAIEEGFIIDVLRNYTPVKSFYKLIKATDSDPEFDTRRAQSKLRKFVESNDHAIRKKAEIMVDHFHDHVIATGKIQSKARAMVVCNGIERAVQYCTQIREYLGEIGSPWKALVAFSGEHDFGAGPVTEASLNQIPSSEIADTFRTDPYRFLICADKFQTGYDEPLLHTMYVDKHLSGIKAVQTLSRLNRAHPAKYDVFVLDFINDTDGIVESFSDYYRTTILSEETDPNRLNDLKTSLDGFQVYSGEEIRSLVQIFLTGGQRDKLDPVLDVCVQVYRDTLNEDDQVKFKGDAKAFVRTYGFMSSILPYCVRGWEELSIFLNLLIPKLPAPTGPEPIYGLIESIDMDSYRVEKKETMRLMPTDEDATLDPVPVEQGGRVRTPEYDRLSNILNQFNDLFGTQFQDGDRVVRRIREEIAPRVALDRTYRNALKNTPQNAPHALDMALNRAMQGLMTEDTKVYKEFLENERFKRFISDMVRDITENGPRSAAN
jgi:type I restriction enzyme R subunit